MAPRPFRPRFFDPGDRSFWAWLSGFASAGIWFGVWVAVAVPTVNGSVPWHLQRFVVQPSREQPVLRAVGVPPAMAPAAARTPPGPASAGSRSEAMLRRSTRGGLVAGRVQVDGRAAAILGAEDAQASLDALDVEAAPGSGLRQQRVSRADEDIAPLVPLEVGTSALADARMLVPPMARREIAPVGSPQATTSLTEVESRDLLLRLRYCYERRVHTDRIAQGKVVLKWALASGRARDVRMTEDTIEDGELAACLTRRVRTYRYHPGHRGLVTLPLVFR